MKLKDVDSLAVLKKEVIKCIGELANNVTNCRAYIQFNLYFPF